MKRKICFVTGTRADYGIQSRLMQRLAVTPGIDLSVIATNMHLSAAHGLTYREIEADGIYIAERIPMDLSDDSPAGTVRALGECQIGMAGALERLRPDMMVVLGDRYEMLAAAAAALIFRIPVSHLYGGETTEGAYDDAIRHAITQMSALHFTSTEQYRQRIIEMGMPEDRVHWVGALGVDNIAATPRLSLGELEESIGKSLGEGFILATFHPVTTEQGQEREQTGALLDALTPLLDKRRVLFTLPNSDTGGSIVAKMITDWTEQHEDRAVAVSSLGRKKYFSALAHCGAVVGNSSSALIEAPSFGKPTLNIGNRQKGRAAGPTVVHSATDTAAIAAGLETVLSPAFMAGVKASGQPLNPYAKEGTLDSIASHIITYLKEL